MGGAAGLKGAALVLVGVSLDLIGEKAAFTEPPDCILECIFFVEFIHLFALFFVDIHSICTLGRPAK